MIKFNDHNDEGTTTSTTTSFDHDDDVPKAKKAPKSEQSKARGKKQVNLKRHMVYLKDFKEGSRTRPVPPLCSDYSQDDVTDLLNKLGKNSMV